MTFDIKWRFLNEGNEDTFFSQVCELNLDDERRGVVVTPSYCAGIYISNLINACNVEEIIEGYRNSEAFRIWAGMTGREYIIQNNVDEHEKYILYDSMAFPAFCILKNVRTMLTELNKHMQNRNYWRWSPCSIAVLRYDRDMIHALNVHELNFENIREYESRIQNCIDYYVEKYNRLLTSAYRGKDNNFYSELCDCLKTYNNGKRRLIKEYLNEKGGRCFATFIRKYDGQKYISFSGFFDAEDNIILNWLGRPAPMPFVAIAKSICASLNAIFVPINLYTRRYKVKSPLPFYIEQWLSINDLIVHGYKAKNYKDYYSCCERKIFGYFNDRTPDGTLYVKMKVCSECGLGLIYQWSKGHCIILRDGLNC
ncbi:MAG: hypothetical protein K2I17_01945 [Clostridia bacterium]|nr:hypothetical protein [Clostridia bacterium]